MKKISLLILFFFFFANITYSKQRFFKFFSNCDGKRIALTHAIEEIGLTGHYLVPCFSICKGCKLEIIECDYNEKPINWDIFHLSNSYVNYEKNGELNIEDGVEYMTIKTDNIRNNTIGSIFFIDEFNNYNLIFTIDPNCGSKINIVTDDNNYNIEGPNTICYGDCYKINNVENYNFNGLRNINFEPQEFIESVYVDEVLQEVAKINHGGTFPEYKDLENQELCDLEIGTHEIVYNIKNACGTKKVLKEIEVIDCNKICEYCCEQVMNTINQDIEVIKQKGLDLSKLNQICPLFIQYYYDDGSIDNVFNPNKKVLSYTISSRNCPTCGYSRIFEKSCKSCCDYINEFIDNIQNYIIGDKLYIPDSYLCPGFAIEIYYKDGTVSLFESMPSGTVELGGKKISAISIYNKNCSECNFTKMLP